MQQRLQTIWEMAQGEFPSSHSTCMMHTHMITESGYSFWSFEQVLLSISEFSCLFLGQSIDVLSYDSVQDLSLLLDSADNRHVLRRLGQSLGVPPQVITHLQGFQDLFQYLRTSTYTMLPQLAQAAALLPNPEVVAKIHQAVVNKRPLKPWGCVTMTSTVSDPVFITLSTGSTNISDTKTFCIMKCITCEWNVSPLWLEIISMKGITEGLTL